ncbi:MAG: hypothetical protein V1922_04785 [bacterium]
MSVNVENLHHSPVVPSFAWQAISLAKRGYNPAEANTLNLISSAETRRELLKRNLETTIKHVFEDSAVSFTNYYQMKRGEVISHPDGVPLRIDSDERGGMYKFGITSAVAGSLENPNQVVLLYSPPGPVVFDDNPNNKFKEVKPYIDGQLYMMYADTDRTGVKKVNNVAISVSGGNGESWIQQIMPEVYQNAKSQHTDIQQVSHFITNPFLTGKSIDQFLDICGNYKDRIIFKNKDGVDFSLSQTLALIRQSLAGQISRSPLVDKVLQHVDMEHITAHDIDFIYGALAQHYMREKGVESLTLGGSCGGEEIQLDVFSHGLDNLSTSFRMVTQGKNIFRASKDFRDDPNLCRCSAAAGPHFHCPGRNKKTKEPCNHAVVVGEGTTVCPDCGAGKTC